MICFFLEIFLSRSSPRLSSMIQVALGRPENTSTVIFNIKPPYSKCAYSFCWIFGLLHYDLFVVLVWLGGLIGSFFITHSSHQKHKTRSSKHSCEMSSATGSFLLKRSSLIS